MSSQPGWTRYGTPSHKPGAGVERRQHAERERSEREHVAREIATRELVERQRAVELAIERAESSENEVARWGKAPSKPVQFTNGYYNQAAKNVSKKGTIGRGRKGRKNTKTKRYTRRN